MKIKTPKAKKLRTLQAFSCSVLAANASSPTRICIYAMQNEPQKIIFPYRAKFDHWIGDAIEYIENLSSVKINAKIAETNTSVILLVK